MLFYEDLTRTSEVSVFCFGGKGNKERNYQSTGKRREVIVSVADEGRGEDLEIVSHASNNECKLFFIKRPFKRGSGFIITLNLFSYIYIKLYSRFSHALPSPSEIDRWEEAFSSSVRLIRSNTKFP